MSDLFLDDRSYDGLSSFWGATRTVAPQLRDEYTDSLFTQWLWANEYRVGPSERFFDEPTPWREALSRWTLFTYKSVFVPNIHVPDNLKVTELTMIRDVVPRTGFDIPDEFVFLGLYYEFSSGKGEEEACRVWLEIFQKMIRENRICEVEKEQDRALKVLAEDYLGGVDKLPKLFQERIRLREEDDRRAT